ncbi:C4-dicarboxylate transporter/malic acid transport protein, partial [mine drainage metagenome]
MLCGRLKPMAALRRFTPNWFTVGMGTGITALGAYTLPGGPLWLKHIGTGLWLVNIGLVSIF